jgi:SARP family transcriptional regulator, regulator of embCAB operon
MRPVDVGPGRKTHTGRLLAIGLAVLALLGGSATAVWRLNSRTPATPLVSSTTAPGTGDVALGSAPPSAGAGPVAALSTAAPSPSQSSPAPSKAAATTGAPSGLVDNFSGTTLDTDRWGVYSATASNGGILSPSAVRVTGGQLQIIGTGTNATGKGNVAGGLCWCGTGGDRLYGIWQVRARFDAGAGYGAIIGLWPNSDDASTTGYISAVNMPGAARTSLYGQVVWSGGADSGDVTGDFTAWHTYTIEWRATFVRLSLDGKVYYDSTKSTAKPVIPHVPLHLYTQVAVGPSDDVPAPNASTPAHVIMHYDWVKMLP